MLKRAYEGDLVVVWAKLDQATDVCEDAHAVASVLEDLIQLSCEIVLIVGVRPKAQGRSCRLILPGLSRYDPSILRP